MAAQQDPPRPAAEPGDEPVGPEQRRARRARARQLNARRRRRRRALGALVAALVVGVGIALAAGGGGSSSGTRSTAPAAGGSGHTGPGHAAVSSASGDARRGTATTTAGTSAPAHTQSVQARRPPPRPSPGSLPQTHAFPSGSDARFRSLMASLWAGIVSGSVQPALPAFFPKAAYVQLKAIPSAASDWSGRLVADYGLDIGAAHALLRHQAGSARLLRVQVPSSYGHWVEPGVCYNAIGYYEMPNARMVYSAGGQVRSLGIASMISWRGVWYVVHLGAVLRSSDSGVVDEPAVGAGSSAPSSTC